MTLHCRRQLQWAASWWCGELSRGCQIAPAWETARGSAATAVWQPIPAVAGRVVLLLGRGRMQALPGALLWEESTLAAHPALTRSLQGPPSLGADPHLLLLWPHLSLQQADHTALLNSTDCLQEMGSSPLQPTMTLNSDPLVPSKAL